MAVTIETITLAAGIAGLAMAAHAIARQTRASAPPGAMPPIAVLAPFGIAAALGAAAAGAGLIFLHGGIAALLTGLVLLAFGENGGGVMTRRLGLFTGAAGVVLLGLGGLIAAIIGTGAGQ